MNVKQIALSFASLVIRAALIVIIVFAVIRFGKQAYEFGYKLFAVETVDEPPGRDIVVSIKDSDGDMDIARMLEEKGLTGDWKLFFLQSKLSEYREPIVPGTYTLNTSMNVDKMLMVMENIEDEEAEEQGEPDELTEQAIPQENSNGENFDKYGYTGDGSEGELIEPEIVEDAGAEGEGE